MSGWARRSFMVLGVGALVLVAAYQRWAPSTEAVPEVIRAVTPATEPAPPTTERRSPSSTAVPSPPVDEIPLGDYALLVALRETGLQYDWRPQPAVVSSTGACGTNQAVDEGSSTEFYIGQQACAEEIIIPALLDGDRSAIDASILAVDWGFGRMADDGSFPGGSDSFHSTGLFLISAARTLLLIEASPLADEYRDVTERWREPLLRAARYEARPGVLRAGRDSDAPFGHRRFLTAAALGLSAAATGDEALRDIARAAVVEGAALQRDDGVLAELDSHDTHYQAYAVVFALMWLQYDTRAPEAGLVIDFIDRALDWETSRILPSGEVLVHGNTRTAGQELNRDGSEKTIVLTFVVRALAGWALETDDEEMLALAARVYAFRQGEPPTSPAPTELAATTWQGGIGHDGHADTVLNDEPIVGWSADFGRDTRAGAPLIVGDRVFVTVGHDALDGSTAAVRVVALDRRTGTVLWEHWLGIGDPAATDRAVLTFGEGLVLTATADGDVQTFDAATGEPGWSKPTGIEVTAAPSAVGGMFVLTGNAVVEGPRPATYGEGPGVWAFRLSGLLAWQHHDPALTGRELSVTDRHVFTLANRGGVVALDLVDGAVTWQQVIPDSGTYGAATISANASTVMVSTGTGRTFVIGAADGRVRHAVVTRSDVPPAMSASTAWFLVETESGSWELQARELDDNRLLGTQPLSGAPAGAPLVVDGVVHVLAQRENRSPSLCEFDVAAAMPGRCRDLPRGGADSPGMAAASHTLVVPLGRVVVSLA